ncbi:MAG: 7-carboxy-7-deazaguanine synthase QueE [Armatimonadetes bacterium]|nr:7-carboxy-7-deazaguanine synthase QueE [Armatimonadota bacterium]
MTNDITGWIHEVFASIQGEGLYCGQRQTFIRFAGCNLACGYCDTAYARAERPDRCHVEESPGSGRFAELSNPVGVEMVVTTCRRLGSEVVALTGGEPLAQPDFLAAVMRDLQKCGLNTYLETNGTLYKELLSVIQYASVIAMDIKLPSASGIDGIWDAHASFLEVASCTDVFVKTVVSVETTTEEICTCAELIADVDPLIPLVIQPVTGPIPVPGDLLMRLQASAYEMLEDVRVIPQCHKVLGLQ